MTSMYEAELVWSAPATSVIVTGEFDDWSKSVQCVKNRAGFSAKVKIPYGKKTDYKFIVDGRWMVNYSSPTEWDPMGNQNNYIMAPSEPPPSVLAVNPAAKAEEADKSIPEPVTPINRSAAPTTSVTPLSVPPTSIATVPGLALDSTIARSVVESLLEVVNPASTKPSAESVPEAEKTNEPASAVKKLADATTMSPPVAAVTERIAPMAAIAHDKVSQGINAINAAVVPHLQAPHTDEPALETKEQKIAEPGYPLRDLASLTGPAPVVLAAKESVGPLITVAQEKLSVAVSAVSEKLTGETPTAQAASGKVVTPPIANTVPEAAPPVPKKEEIDGTSSIISLPVVAPAPVDLGSSPTEVKPLNGFHATATSPAVPTVPEAVATPTVNGVGSTPATPSGINGTVSSGYLSSGPTTPTKLSQSRRSSSFGSKFFHSRRNSGSDAEDSAGKGSVKKSDSVRSKRTSLIGKVKAIFHHEHHEHPNGTNNGTTTEKS